MASKSAAVSSFSETLEDLEQMALETCRKHKVVAAMHTASARYTQRYIDQGFRMVMLVADRMADKRFEELPNASVVPDTTNNRLLVTASEEQLKEIQQVVAIIDIAPEKQEREMAVIPVQSKPPAELIIIASLQLNDTAAVPYQSFPIHLISPTLT